MENRKRVNIQSKRESSWTKEKVPLMTSMSVRKYKRSKAFPVHAPPKFLHVFVLKLLDQRVPDGFFSAHSLFRVLFQQLVDEILRLRLREDVARDLQVGRVGLLYSQI